MSLSDALKRFDPNTSLASGRYNFGDYDATTNPLGMGDGGFQQPAAHDPTLTVWEAYLADLATVGPTKAAYGQPVEWTFDSATADADPGAGKLRLDAADQTTATKAYVDDQDVDGASVAPIVATWGDPTSSVKGILILQDLTDETKWLLYKVTGVTNASGYKKLSLTYVAGSGGSALTDGENVVAYFARTGDKGDKGDEGDPGTDGALSFDWTTVTGAYTASADERILADTSGGAFTLTLPGSPSQGDSVWLADPGESWGANNLTVSGNGNNVEGAGTFTANVDGGAFECVFNGTQWRVRFASGV